ncbi:hypothetical protein QYM36_015121, partial [Artemia franciscana]
MGDYQYWGRESKELHHILKALRAYAFNWVQENMENIGGWSLLAIVGADIPKKYDYVVHDMSLVTEVDAKQTTKINLETGLLQGYPCSGTLFELYLDPFCTYAAERIDGVQAETSGKFPSGNAKQALQLYKDCHHLISKIIHIEEEVSKTTDKCCDRRKDYGQLVKWLQDNGAKIVNLKIEEYDGLGNGLKATTKIKKQDLSILIPKKTMITSESAISSTIGHIIKADILLGQMPNVSLALHLLNESLDPSSFWTPYIKTLPREFTTVFYFEEELLELLQKSAFFEEIVKIYVSIARQYSYIFKVIQ